MESQTHHHNFNLNDLNTEQLEAVKFWDTPLMVLAGAGSGKTKMLTSKIAYLVKEKNVNPWNILALTFSNKAAGEMRLRVRQIMNLAEDAALPQISTFHAFCARFLRKHHEAASLTSSFTIYDDSDQLILIKKLMDRMGISTKSLNPKAVKFSINFIKNQGITPQGMSHIKRDLESKEALDVLAHYPELYGNYEGFLRDNNAIDFGGLILKSVEVLKQNKQIASYYHRKLSYLFVDEYQDTNRSQYCLIKEFVRGTEPPGKVHMNLSVVGDEDQSIYGWRGADINNILNFKEDYPGFKLIKLEQNYRSSKIIIEASSKLIAHNFQRNEKTLWTDNPSGEKIKVRAFEDERGEATGVVREIQKCINAGVSPKEIAIFYRTNAQSRVMEDQLRRTSLQYKIIGGLKFYERKEIKDLIAYMRIIVNPSDNISLERIINVPARGIGKKTVEKILELALELELSFMDTLEKVVSDDETNLSISPGHKKKLKVFFDMMMEFRDLEALEAPSDLLKTILELTEYQSALEREGTIESESRLMNISELHSALQEWEEESQKIDIEGENKEENTENDSEDEVIEDRPRLSAFLESVTLKADSDDIDSENNSVSLMTVHAAKGLEFSRVMVVGLEEGLFPLIRGDGIEGDEELEEERRLCYVAMTRAKHVLSMNFAKTRRSYGGRVFYNEASRFLYEIPENLIDETGFRRSSKSSRSFNNYDEVSQDTGDSDYAQQSPNYDYVPEGMEEIKTGNKVRHPSYGVGVIKGSEGSGDSIKVSIEFKNKKVRKFALKFVQLELVDS